MSINATGMTYPKFAPDNSVSITAKFGKYLWRSFVQRDFFSFLLLH